VRANQFAVAMPKPAPIPSHHQSQQRQAEAEAGVARMTLGGDAPGPSTSSSSSAAASAPPPPRRSITDYKPEPDLAACVRCPRPPFFAAATRCQRRCRLPAPPPPCALLRAPLLPQSLISISPASVPLFSCRELAAAAAADAAAGRAPLHLVVLGHVDAGKSTLMGRLLHDLGHVSQKEAHKNARDSAAAGKARCAPLLAAAARSCGARITLRARADRTCSARRRWPAQR